MRSRIAVGAGVALLAMGTLAHAQTTTTAQQPESGIHVTTETLNGVVVATEGNKLVAKMQPSGEFRFFDVQPGRQFIIDGQTKLIGDLKPGTVLNAKFTTKTQPLTVRTTTVTNGTVWYVAGNYLIVTLENGENKDYKVPEGFLFTVEGRQVPITSLRKGMKLSATRIVHEPITEISQETKITGTAPK